MSNPLPEWSELREKAEAALQPNFAARVLVRAQREQRESATRRVQWITVAAVVLVLNAVAYGSYLGSTLFEQRQVAEQTVEFQTAQQELLSSL